MNIKNIKNCSCEKRLIGKLVLGCEDKILTTTKTSPYNKRVTCEKRNCFNHTILLAIIRLLFLAVASIGCYYYYTRDWMKKEYLVSYWYKMNRLKEINIKNRTFYYFDDIIQVENVNFGNILLHEKSYENILVYDILYKTLTGTKPLRISFDKKIDLLEFLIGLDI